MNYLKKLFLNIITWLVLIPNLSCSSFNEVHYFKDKVEKKQGSFSNLPPNYYKVEIKGYSFLSSSRYVSGYFDQNAINLYFNEFSQPKDGKLLGNDSSGSCITDEKGNELVLILSTNAKAVTDQIGNISKNQTILNSLSQISQKEQIQEAEDVKLQIKFTEMEIENLKLNTDLYLIGLSNKTPADQKRSINQLTQILNAK